MVRFWSAWGVREDGDAGRLAKTVTVIPEPATASLLGLGRIREASGLTFDPNVHLTQEEDIQ